MYIMCCHGMEIVYGDTWFLCIVIFSREVVFLHFCYCKLENKQENKSYSAY